MSNSRGRFRPARRLRLAAFTVGATLGLVLSACGGGGGGGGGGNGEAAYTLRVAFANQTEEAATIQLDGGEPTTVDSCKGGVFTFAIPATDWLVLVNGEPAIDSLEYEPNQLDNDIVARLWLREDGSTEIESFLPGSNVNPPATLAICS